jgi:DDE family transposase
MWLGLLGERRRELSGEEIYWAYRNRYDIEHFFRFGKQRLLLDKFQTPDEEHLQNWLEVVSLSYWLLWPAVEAAGYECPKWQKYDKNLKKRRENGLAPSPSQVQQQIERIILGFEQDPFLPKLQIKGKGRQRG